MTVKNFTNLYLYTIIILMFLNLNQKILKTIITN